LRDDLNVKSEFFVSIYIIGYIRAFVSLTMQAVNLDTSVVDYQLNDV
jgi:hypothetical protein